MYYYYFNDELIYSSDSQATENKNGYTNPETGETEWTSYTLRFKNDDYITVTLDGFEIHNIEEINSKKI